MQHLSFFPTTPSIDEIEDLKNVIKPTTSSDEDDEEVLRSVSVSGFKHRDYLFVHELQQDCASNKWEHWRV